MLSLAQLSPSLFASFAAPSSAPSPAPESSNSASASLTRPNKQQKKSAPPAVSEEAARQEYLKIQLDLAHTKKTSLDVTLKSKDESISILSERL